MDKLEKLGYGEWFRNHADPSKITAHEVARVIAVHKDRCVITKGDGDVFAEYSGNLLYLSDSPCDLPTTGDWVYADFFDNDSFAIIHGILPRKTVLKRKTAGKMIDFQLIAANIDVAFIMQSVDDNFNLRRLERYLAMVHENQITPIILLSKSDLFPPEEVEKIKKDMMNTAPGTRVLALSNMTGENITAIKNSLMPGKTYCLLGSSGVGKTTLLNSIVGSNLFQTQTVSKKQSKGRHTTTRRELIQLNDGALLIDTPGMRELGSISVDAGINQTFSEIGELAEHCHFGDCTHTNEKGCAILSAIDAGELDQQRYKNYLKMKNESAFYDMSYSDRRKKDKDFGKMVKSVMQSKKKR